MTTTKEALKQRIPEVLDDLRNMRDRIRLKAHLAKMDVQSAWKETEQKIDELTQRFTNATEDKLADIEEAAKQLKLRMKKLEYEMKDTESKAS